MHLRFSTGSESAVVIGKNNEQTYGNQAITNFLIWETSIIMLTFDL